MVRAKDIAKERKANKMITRRELIITVCCLVCSMLWGQTSFNEPTTLFVMHSSGNHLERGSDGGGWIESPTKSNPQKLTFVPVGQGYYTIQVEGQQRYLSLTGQWNSTFTTDPSADEAKWAIEPAMLWSVRRSAKFFSYYPAETLTNFVTSFAHSLSHIEE